MTPHALTEEPLRALRILVVDDSPGVREMIQAYLQLSPHELEFAENGLVAVEKFLADDFDLVLMDVQMPLMDGHAATEAIRKVERLWGRRRTPIITVSASVAQDVGKRSLEAGCDLHLAKPISRSKLLEILNSYSG